VIHEPFPCFWSFTLMLRRLLLVLAASAPLALPACTGGGSTDDAEVSEDELRRGPISTFIERRLTTRNPRERDRTWAMTSATLPRDWLVQVPVASTWGAASIVGPRTCNASSPSCEPDFRLVTCQSDADCEGSVCTPLAATRKSPEAAPTRVCAGHSDAILDQIHEVMTSAESYLDISTLTAPRGRFLAAVRNGLSVLDRKGKPITVRFLVGSYIGAKADLPAILNELARDLPRDSQVALTVASHHNTVTSWNHSKIIAADGRDAIVGGMNLWGDHYLDSEPVHDVSLRLKGPAAAASQAYLDELWEEPCTDPGSVRSRERRDACPLPFAVVSQQLARAPEGNVPIITVGRLGKFNRNPSDTALVALMDAATSTIKISQQDIGSIRIVGGSLPEAYMDAWTRAALRDVDVTIIVSPPGAYGGTGRDKADAYSNGWSLPSLWRGLVIRSEVNYERATDRVEKLCRHVHFATMRTSAAPGWPSGSPVANHAKVVIADDRAHYVGSQNLYNANLAEFGVIVDDREATRTFLREYYDKLAEHSVATTYLDPSCRR